MSDAIVRYDRGAAAPLEPMARAQRATAPYGVPAHRAREIRAGEPSARARHLLHDRHGRESALATTSAVELAAWMLAFKRPTPGNNRPGCGLVVWTRET